ncbi:hypothetical protein DI005_02675 [Prauserella sp. PE36]|nr:hypothetical protein DI005_02675 [Prauserella sp. PE36]
MSSRLEDRPTERWTGSEALPAQPKPKLRALRREVPAIEVTLRRPTARRANSRTGDTTVSWLR